MAAPLRTLFLLEDLCYGGTQKQNMALAARLHRDSFQPLVLTLTGPTDLDAQVGDADIELHHLGRDRKAAPFFFGRLGRALRRLRPHILVCCTALPNIWGRLWGRALGIPLIIGTCRGGGAPLRQHEWAMAHLAHGIVCNSAPLLTTLTRWGMPQDRLAHVANGVDTEHFCPAPQDPGPESPPTIVCVARLAADKDHKTLLRAFELAAQHFPETRLQLVGEGPEEESLKAMAAASPMAAHIEFAGATADAAPYLRQGTIFALSSRREGLPNAIMEAMACGLPVCATAVGGVPQLLEDCGLLSAAGDAQAMARNLCALLADAHRGRALGRAGRQRVIEEYSFKTMVQKHEDFFTRLWKRYAPGNEHTT